MVHNAFQTRRWNGVAAKLSGTSKTRRWPAKYSASSRRVCSRMGELEDSCCGLRCPFTNCRVCRAPSDAPARNSPTGLSIHAICRSSSDEALIEVDIQPPLVLPGKVPLHAIADYTLPSLRLAVPIQRRIHAPFQRL